MTSYTLVGRLSDLFGKSVLLDVLGVANTFQVAAGSSLEAPFLPLLESS